MAKIDSYSNKTPEASDKMLGSSSAGVTNNFALSGVKDYIREDDNQPIERTKGFSTGLENGHRWVTGGDELYAIDELEGTAWAVGGFSATLPQNIVANQKRGGIIHPLKRHMLDFEEYSVLVGIENSTPAISGSITSSMTEISKTTRAVFGIKFITEESLVGDKLVHEIYYGSDDSGVLLFRYDYKNEEITASIGDEVSLWFSSPYEVNPNTEIFHQTFKADGNLLNIRQTAESTATPYIVHLMRQYEDMAQLYMPIYNEYSSHEEDDRIWRADSILVAMSNIIENTAYPRPFHMDEWSEVGTAARYQLSNSPTINFDLATSVSSFADTSVSGNFKIAFHYDGGGGTTPVYAASADGMAYLKRDNTTGEWILAITGVEYSISDAVDPIIEDEICFNRVGEIFEVCVNNLSRGTTAVSNAPFVGAIIGNLPTPTLETSAGKIHDMMVVNEFNQLVFWAPMQECSGTTGYDVIGGTELTYTDVSWSTQNSTNHARNYGVRIEGGVCIPGKIAGITGAEAANGLQMTHYPKFGDNGCGIGDIIGFNGTIGKYKEIGSLAVVTDTPFSLPIDGSETTEEYPAGVELWDITTNKTNLPTNHQNIRTYRIRLSYIFNAESKDRYMNVQIRLAGGAQTEILEWDDSIVKSGVDVTYTGERTIYTTPDILTNQLEVYMEANTDGTITSQEILIIEG